jgi:signal transduction histidine kinase
VSTSKELAPERELKHGLQLPHNLARQFALIAAAALLVAMLVMGKWVSKKIETSVAVFAGASAALYINTFISPHLQELAFKDALSATSIEALNKAIEKPAVRAHVTAVKVWKQNGLIIYSSDEKLIGRVFTPTTQLQQAWSGAVATELDDRHHEEHEADRLGGMTQLEVYAPIRDANTGDVIAVLEFYENAEGLDAQLSEAEWQSWGVTALVTLAIVAALFSIVSNGSKIIDHLRTSLSHRISQLKELLRQNEALRAHVERAARRVDRANEAFMPRMASDLRNGPAQSVTIALLHLNALEQEGMSSTSLTAIRTALSQARKDIWNLASGLLLPEVESLTLEDAIFFVTNDYESRTRETVYCSISSPLPNNVPSFVKSCASRFVQACLDNVHQQGSGRDLQISVSSDARSLTVELANLCLERGVSLTAQRSTQLGLAGIWDQIESIGGTITISNQLGGEASFTAWLPLTE